MLQVWRDTEPQKGAQLVFCDLSTPHGDGSFNVYDDIKQKLMAQGVPPEQIAFMVSFQKLRHKRKATRLPRQQSRKPAQRRQNISR